jgi:hypothetical protein
MRFPLRVVLWLYVVFNLLQAVVLIFDPELTDRGGWRLRSCSIRKMLPLATLCGLPRRSGSGWRGCSVWKS